MDLPYSQQQQARRKNRSAANLQHLSLAPLTTRLPLRDDPDAPADFLPAVSTPSYLQGRSAPVTPRLLSTSPPPPPGSSRSRSHDGKSPFPLLASHGRHGHSRGSLPKSLSTTHLTTANRPSGTGTVTGTASPQHNHRRRRAHHPLSATTTTTTTTSGDLFSPSSSSPSDHRTHSDWLLRAGAIVTSETREFKGQSWLIARASSTSLSGLRDLDDDGGLARERVAQYQRTAAGAVNRSRRGSWNRHTADGDDDDAVAFAVSPLGGGGSRLGSCAGSRLASRAHSRTVSRTTSRVQLITPLAEDRQLLCDGGSFFGRVDVLELDEMVGPDFVNLDHRLEALEQDTSLEDEDHVRRLVKREKAGSGVLGSWLGTVFGWPLFFAHENDDGDDEDDDDDSDGRKSDDDDDDDNDVDGEGAANGDAYSDDDDDNNNNNNNNNNNKVKDDILGNVRKSWRHRRRRPSGPHCLEGDPTVARDYVPPPPKADGGGWHDAAWLLSVASKVIL